MGARTTAFLAAQAEAEKIAAAAAARCRAAVAPGAPGPDNLNLIRSIMPVPLPQPKVAALMAQQAAPLTGAQSLYNARFGLSRTKGVVARR